MAIFGTVSEYARHRECAPVTVYAALKDGRIRRMKDRRLNFVECDLRWPGGKFSRKQEPDTVRAIVRETLNDMGGNGDVHGEDKETLHAQTIRWKRAQADLAEAKVQREKRQLLDAGEVERAVRVVVRKAALALENGVVQWAVLVAGKTDLREIEGILRAEVDRVRVAFAEDMERVGRGEVRVEEGEEKGGEELGEEEGGDE